MHELILANLLFHAGAGTALMLIAAGSATRDLHARRPVRHRAAALPGAHNVVELPGSRVSHAAPRVEAERHPEAA